MAIVEVLTLPNQPTTGEVFFLPYGGDGFVAPAAAWVVKGFGVTGDASGGNVGLNIELDNRFCSLIGYHQVSVNTVADVDEDVRMSIRSALEPDLTVLGLMVSHPQFGTDCNALWVPPGIIYPGERVTTLAADIDNVLNDVYTVNALIYLFDIRVRTQVPLPPLLASSQTTFLSLG